MGKRTALTLIALLFVGVYVADSGLERPLRRVSLESGILMHDIQTEAGEDSVVLNQVDAGFIMVSKEDLTLTVYDFKSNPVVSFPMCCGAAYGNKQKEGDGRTPEGIFKVRRIENSTKWPHRDANGKKEYGCYGPTFIRLEYPPLYHIGIHGTNQPESVGKRESEGCVRLRNEDLARLLPYVYVGMPVIITPSMRDAAVNKAYSIKPDASAGGSGANKKRV